MTELELLETRIWRSGLQDVLVGVVIFVMALGVLAGAVTKWNDPAGKPWFMLVLGPIFVWVAWLMASGGRRKLEARTQRAPGAIFGFGKEQLRQYTERVRTRQR